MCCLLRYIYSGCIILSWEASSLSMDIVIRWPLEPNKRYRMKLFASPFKCFPHVGLNVFLNIMPLPMECPEEWRFVPLLCLLSTTLIVQSLDTADRVQWFQVSKASRPLWEDLLLLVITDLMQYFLQDVRYSSWMVGIYRSDVSAQLEEKKVPLL